MANGYLMVRICIKGKIECTMAHRLVWRVLRGPIPQGLSINHKDGVKTNNHPDNLELATNHMQAMHAIRVLKRYQPVGENCSRVTLTTEQVEEMRRRRLEGELVKVLANDFGVSGAQVSRITRGVQWGHVKGSVVETPSKPKERKNDTMDFNYYQQQAAKTAIYPGSGTTNGLFYVALGLLSEAGEVAGAAKRILRDDGGVLTEDRRKQLISEVSDCIWYISQLCTELGVTFEEVAHRNLIKLNSRKERGTLTGSGDNR
jgi:NTP pyrophosphatase (non-canonical NTP hydrolase)